MNELAQIVMVLLAGVLLGGLFFGGLWWTVQKGLTADKPALWFGASMLLRTAVVLAGFYFIAGPDWRRLLVCVLGFIAARLIVTRLTAKRFALSPNFDGTTSRSTKLAKNAGQVDGYLPRAVERDEVSLREFHTNEADHAS